MQLYRSYRLPDSAYGELLIYEGIKPVYYLNLFDQAYADLSSYQLNTKVPIHQLIKRVLQLNKKHKLSVCEAVWLS